MEVVNGVFSPFLSCSVLFFFFPWFSPLFFFLVCWAVIVDTEGGDAWLDRMGWGGMGWDRTEWGLCERNGVSSYSLSFLLLFFLC